MMTDITDEVNFYKKNIFNLNEHYRTKRISEYMNDEEIAEQCYDGQLDAYYCVNSCNNFTKLIRENESDELIVGEGLIKTYPASKMLRLVKKFFADNLPKELYDLKMAQTEIVKSASHDMRIVDMKDERYANVNEPISKMTFIFPFFKDDNLKKFIADLADSAYVCGYNYANSNVFSVAVQPFNEKKIVIVLALFEAKYHEEDFQFSKNLYHITTLDALDKIRRDGLVPKSKSNKFSYPDRVYLFNNASQQMIFDYIESKLANLDEQTAIVIKIDSNRLQNCDAYKTGKMKFYIDHMFDSADHEANAVFTYDNVDAKMFEDDVLVVNVKNGHIERTRTGNLHDV